MRFCSAGTAALPTSIARSPRATMMPSLAWTMLSSTGMASLRSILAISPGLWRHGSPATLASWRAISMSVALFGKLTARYSHWKLIAVLMSSMSLPVSAGAVRPPPCLLMPLLLDSTPPTRTVVWTCAPLHLVDVQHDQAVVEQQGVAGLHVARQLLVVEADRGVVAEFVARAVEHELLPGRQLGLAAFELADADLRALQVGHDRHRAPGALGRGAHHRRAIDVVLRGAVREIQAHDIDTGGNQPLQHSGDDEAGPSVATILVSRAMG